MIVIKQKTLKGVVCTVLAFASEQKKVSYLELHEC
jgi:hypothetical protein